MSHHMGVIISVIGWNNKQWKIVEKSNSSQSNHNGLQALYLSIVLSVFTIITGVLGYLWLLSPHVTVFDALYMTIVTLSTVGYNEIIDLSAHPWARTFTMGLILFGVGNLLFLFTSITAFLSDNEIKESLKRRRLMKTLKRYQNHLIICGIGNVGARVVRELIKFTQAHGKLNKKSTGIVVIDNNTQVLEKFRKEFPRFSQVVFLEGDATDETVLQQAGIERASQVITTLSDDRDNVLLVVTAKKQRPDIRVIAKIKDIKSRDKLIAAGADAVISPQYIGALRMVNEVLNPHSQHVIDNIINHGRTDFSPIGKGKQNTKHSTTNDFHWQELHFRRQADASHWVGKTVEDLGIIQNFSIPVIAIKNGKEINYRPKRDTLIKENDILILITNSEEIKKLRKHLGI